MPNTPIQNLADATQPPPMESVEARFRRLDQSAHQRGAAEGVGEFLIEDDQQFLRGQRE
jgi:hypothetical protein